MATRSTIGMIQEDGTTIRSVYCHWDGYPDGVGATLAEYYTDTATIDRLLDLGDLSVLDENLGQKHDFENRPEGMSSFYHRDRDESWGGTQALVHADLREWLGFRERSWCEYGYLWDGQRWNTYKIEAVYA